MSGWLSGCTVRARHGGGPAVIRRSIAANGPYGTSRKRGSRDALGC